MDLLAVAVAQDVDQCAEAAGAVGLIALITLITLIILIALIILIVGVAAAQDVAQGVKCRRAGGLLFAGDGAGLLGAEADAEAVVHVKYFGDGAQRLDVHDLGYGRQQVGQLRGVEHDVQRL